MRPKSSQYRAMRSLAKQVFWEAFSQLVDSSTCQRAKKHMQSTPLTAYKQNSLLLLSDRRYREDFVVPDAASNEILQRVTRKFGM